MARIPRKEVIDDFEIGAYHCVQRCVRRAFLCGEDHHSGQNYNHRKLWLQQRMEFLAGEMAVEFLGFTVLRNHLHLILRNRPDVVRHWTDEEVARRWWNLCPGRKDENGRPAQPSQHELDAIMADPTQLAVKRGRLSSISWLMRFLAEPIARRANREDECTGRFWEGRYKCQRLLDEASLLACCMYVDLNPIRAGLAGTPETSEFTAAYERIQALTAACQQEAETGEDPSLRGRPGDEPARDGWLSPIYLEQRRNDCQEQRPRRRATNRGFLPLQTSEYLQLLDATGRLVRADKRGAIPQEYAPLFERLGLSRTLWVDTVRNFGRWFHRAVGATGPMTAEAQRHGRQWLAGISHARAVFG